MVIERMLVWTGARQNRAWTQVTYLRASVRIDGSRTAVGYIKRQSRRDFGTHAFLDNFELWEVRSNRAFPSYVGDSTSPLIWADSQQFDFARLVCAKIGNSPGTGGKQQHHSLHESRSIASLRDTAGSKKSGAAPRTRLVGRSRESVGHIHERPACNFINCQKRFQLASHNLVE